MAKSVNRYISELLQAYQTLTGKTIDVTLSNLYLYRNGKGNPRAKTIDKIVDTVGKYCPEALDHISKGGIRGNGNL